MDNGKEYCENDPLDRTVILNVSGIKYETHIATLQNISDTRLSWLTENIDHKQEIFFDRHPGAFVYILNFYRTGKLHIPTDMCGPAFEEELQFWGIDEKQMEPCCWETFTKHREAEDNLRYFEGPEFDNIYSNASRKHSTVQAAQRQSNRVYRYMEKVWNILDNPHSSKAAKLFSLLSCSMIILSVVGYCLGTMPAMKERKEILKDINYMCVAFFTCECIARLISTPDRKGFLLDYTNWIDFISVVPSYLVIFFRNKWVENLVIIRLLRVFKFFKLSYGLQVLVHTFKASSYELTLLLLVLLIPLVIFSSIMYAIESNLHEGSKFDSVPTSFWWCLITMTTVGYGDFVPVTWPGRLIGSLCAICGLLTIALPISVIGGNFNLYYSHAKARLKLPKKKRNLLANMSYILRQKSSFLSSRDRDRTKLNSKSDDGELSPFSKRIMKERLEGFHYANKSIDITADVNNDHQKLPINIKERKRRRNSFSHLECLDNGTTNGEVIDGSFAIKRNSEDGGQTSAPNETLNCTDSNTRRNSNFHSENEECFHELTCDSTAHALQPLILKNNSRIILKQSEDNIAMQGCGTLVNGSICRDTFLSDIFTSGKQSSMDQESEDSLKLINSPNMEATLISLKKRILNHLSRSLTDIKCDDDSNKEKEKTNQIIATKSNPCRRNRSSMDLMLRYDSPNQIVRKHENPRTAYSGTKKHVASANYELT